MNRVQAILTLDMENIPANFPEIIKHEQEVVANWKEEGILESLYLRKEKIDDYTSFIQA
jgi:muconolactone D-isomerase